MRIVADLHVHTKYARGTSPSCDIGGLAEGAKTKGIDLIATGDFTYPAYFEEIKARLQGGEDGIYEFDRTKFILSTEISLIYSGGDRARKMHHVVLCPSIEIASQINDQLGKRGNLSSDGRPILGMSSAACADEILSISKENIIIPAHIWTPWFSLVGSKSGVDTLEEAFEEHSDRIFALETGLSSDPAMNWMLSGLDRYTLVSNSDAHSLGKLGREANVFDLDGLSFRALSEALRTRKGFVKTYEFYPEEGKYHYDGHRKCDVLLSPWESRSRKDICPVCRKKLTVGVLRRPGRPEGGFQARRRCPVPAYRPAAHGDSQDPEEIREHDSRIGGVFEAHQVFRQRVRCLRGLGGAATPGRPQGDRRFPNEGEGRADTVGPWL